MPICARPSRAVFRISGSEAEKLLGDTLTTRVKAEPGPARWFALLSPQGKIQAEGLIGWAEDAFWLDVDRVVAAEFFRRMRMYKLRAQVQIDDVSATHAVGWAEDLQTAGLVHEDGRRPGLGFRVIAELQAAGTRDTPDAWAVKRISEGIAELGPDFGTDTIFPHDIGMDLLGGVDFVKGCYIGQEVVSRMQHRGTARRRPVIVSGLPEDVAPGAAVAAGGREAGVLGEVVEGRSVAILRLDRISDPASVSVDDRPVTLALPSWATYAFGESARAE